MPHIDFSVVVGIAVGIIGAAAHFRTAKLNVVKTEVESLCRQVKDLETKCTSLEGRCQQLEAELDRAERKVEDHYTARIAISEENRQLNQLVRERDETIIDVQAKIIQVQERAISLLKNRP